MNLTKIYLIIFYQIIQILRNTGSDHVQVIGCSQTPQCLNNLNKQLLEIIKENMEIRSQPCENFWNYACGSWTSAPYDDHLDNFGALANYYADNLIATLTELQKYEMNISKLVDQIMKYFESCRMQKVLKTFNMALYLKELPSREIFGANFRWHRLFQADIWQDFDWLEATALLRKYGFRDLFIQESVGFARHNSQQQVVQLKIPQAKINGLDKYQVLQIMEKFKLIFDIKAAKNYLQLVDEVVEFDSSLQKLYVIYGQGKAIQQVLLQDLPSLQLYFQLLLNQALPAEIVVEISGNSDYFNDLETLLNGTAKTVQGTYTLLKFGQYLMDILPLLTERECMLHTNVMFPLGINYIYYRFLYKNHIEDERVLQFLFATLRKEFAEMIMENKNDLEFFEIQQLEKKLKRMQLKIGNLPLSLNETHINLYYSQIQLKEYNFYHNHLEMLKFRTWQQHQTLLDRSFSQENFYVNDDISQLRTAPYFIHQRNMIIVPMVFLQLPFYHHAQHPLLQFSLVGWILGHELSHAFDSHGLAFDGWGNENLVGLKLSTKASFSHVGQCLVAHAPAVSLNERMADVNGLQLAFQTFFHHLPKNMDVLSLKKLFFIHFAQFFCGSLPRAIGHDRDDVRVRQSVSNMKEFSEVFQCPATAKENPQRKCSMWRI